MPAATETKNWPRAGLYCCLRPGCASDFEGPSNMAHTQPCPSCGWGPLMEFTPTVVEIHRLQVSSDPLTLEESADYLVRDTLARPLNDAPEALCLGFGTISIRGGGALAIGLSDETEILLLAGIPPDSEEGLALWALLGPTSEAQPEPATPMSQRERSLEKELRRLEGHKCDPRCPKCAAKTAAVKA